MRSVITLAVLSITLVISPTVAQADLTVSNSLSLTQLLITPAFGEFSILYPFSAETETVAEDTLGGYATNGNVVYGDDTGATPASTTIASANAEASSSSFTASASSGVNIIGVPALAVSLGESGIGDYTGYFEILDVNNPNPTPVSVAFSAALSGYQSLTTDSGGVFATSEIGFDLGLSTMNSPLLSFDSSLCIGNTSPDVCAVPSPNSIIAPYSNTLTASAQLSTNTPYYFVADMGAESEGFNASPEPSFSFFTGLGFFTILFCSLVRRRQQGFRKTT